jgi:hypothetical protein
LLSWCPTSKKHGHESFYLWKQWWLL